MPQPVLDLTNTQTPKRGADHLDGQEVRTKKAALAIRSGEQVQIRWNMVDRNGDRVNLEEVASLSSSGSSVLTNWSVRFRLAHGFTRVSDAVLCKSAEVYDAAQGLVKVELAKADVPGPGIYIAEIAIITGDDEAVVLGNQFYLVVERSVFGDGSLLGPPLLAEIRLLLRDSAGSENELIDHVDFDDAEIALAADMCVAYWNEALPPLSTDYTTSNFPYRYHWVQGIGAHLFQIAAEHYRRNDLQYSAAGVQVADKRKAQDYEAKAAQLMGAWQNWVKTKKASINIMGWGGTLDSDYAY